MIRFITSFLLVITAGFTSQAQDPFKVELNPGDTFLDVVVFLDKPIVLSSSKKGYWLTEFAASSTHRTLLKVDVPLGLVLDIDRNVYLKTIDSVYMVNIDREKIGLGSSESVENFNDRLNKEKAAALRDVKFNYVNNATHVYFHHPVNDELEDSIIISADYRSSEFKRFHTGQTVDQIKNNPNVGVRTPYSNVGGATVVETDSLGRPSIVDKEPVFQQRMQQTRKNQYARSSAISSTSSSDPRLFHTKSGVVIIDGDLANVMHYTNTGKLLSTNAIDFERPLVWSNGYDEFIYDKNSDRLLIYTENSKGIQVSQLNFETGIATLLFKVPYGLELTKFVIQNHLLIYVQSYKGRYEMYEVDIE